MDGIHILKTMRLQPSTERLPVVIMTSSHTDSELETCRSLGVSSYVLKPMTAATFTKAVADSFHAPGNR